jgi:hypothetical protein
MKTWTEGGKVCKKCKALIAWDGFYVNTKTSDGYQVNCKRCTCALATQWRRDHKQQSQDTARKYWKVWYANNRDYDLSRHVEWYKNNKQKSCEARKQWATLNPEKDKAIRKRASLKYRSTVINHLRGTICVHGMN